MTSDLRHNSGAKSNEMCLPLPVFEKNTEMSENTIRIRNQQLSPRMQIMSGWGGMGWGGVGGWAGGARQRAKICSTKT